MTTENSAIRYSKERFAKGICPICSLALIRTQWFHNSTIVYEAVFNGGSWVKGEPELHRSDDDPVTEYNCENCQLTFHVDSTSFVGDG